MKKTEIARMIILALFLVAVPSIVLANMIPAPSYHLWVYDIFGVGSLLSFSIISIIALLPVFLVGLTVEFLLSFLFIKTTKISKRILRYVLFANLISFPIFCLLFYLGFFFLVWLYDILGDTTITIWALILELPVIIFEGRYIYVKNKEYISSKKAYVLSSVMNVGTIVLGFLILWVIQLWR